MKVGDVVTISINRNTGDRSYIGDVWQIIGENNTHVEVKSLYERRSWFLKSLLLKEEYDFTIDNEMRCLNPQSRNEALTYKEFIFD